MPGAKPAKAYFVLVGVGLAFVLAAGGIAYRSVRDYRTEKAWVVHTYTVLATLDRLHLALLEAHREKRGFAIAGDAAYLVSYDAAVSSFESILSEIQGLTRDNLEQQETLATLRTRLSDLLRRMNEQISERRSRGFDPAREMPHAREMEVAIEECRSILKEMRLREERLLAARSTIEAQRSAAMLRTIALTISAAVFFLAFATWRSRVELTLRTRSEEALREKEERLYLAVSGGGLGTWDLDFPTGRLAFNARWAEMIGYTPEELVPELSTWERLVHPDDLPKAYQALEHHLSGGSPDYRVEKRLRGKRGNWVWVLAMGRVIGRDPLGAPLRICGTHLDITENKTKSETLQAFAEELERSNKELDDFAYIASHDLKEPLRGIRNYANFLLEDYGERLEEDGQAKLNTLTKLADRLETFIEDLLRYSRVGREAFALKPCDTGAMVADVVSLLGPWLEQEGAHVEIAHPMPVVKCHPVYATEVFKNLIGNGVKYNNNVEKRVWVGCAEGDKGPPTFHVRDNGIGIPERHHASIFQIFKRLHGRDKFGGGSGAGLTITRKIVERHGGRIWVESVEGEGTTFHFTLSNGEHIR